MIWAVVGALALVVIVIAVATVFGRLRLHPLPEPVSSVHALELPAAVPLTADAVAQVRFDTALRGYDPGPVDALLAQWSAWLTEHGGDAPPDPRTATFRQVLRGYRMDQVDEVLDRLATSS